MDERRTIEFRIGVVVMATIAVLVILIFMFGPKKVSWFSGDYKINVIFPHAPKIQPGSPVEKIGVEIGRVSTTELVENDQAVKVVLLVHKDVKIYSDDECKIFSNIMGQTAISFRRNPKAKGPTSFEETKVLPPDSTIYGFAPTDIIQIADSLETRASEAMKSFTNATNEVTTAFNNINSMMGTPEEIDRKQKRLEEMVTTAMKTMSSIDRLSVGVDNLINDPEIQHNLKTTAKDIPKIVTQVQELMNSADGMIGDVRAIMTHMNQTFDKVDSNLDNVTKFTNSLGKEGSEFFNTLNVTAERLELTMNEIQKFMAALNNADGSVGELLNDPEFFNGLRRTAKNIEDISLQIKPILADARVASDKIARDPGGTIGVRSLLTKSPQTKGTPSSNIGYIGSKGEFPEPQPEFRLARSPNWWQCPLGAARPQYKYVMPTNMSTGYRAEYYEWPEALQTPTPTSTPYEPQYLQEVPQSIAPAPVIAPPPPRRITPAPALTSEAQQTLDLDFASSKRPAMVKSEQNHHVKPLPAIGPVSPFVASGHQEMELDFSSKKSL